MPVTCSVSPITFQNQTLEVKKIVEFFEFLVTGKGVQIIVENSNFWSWKKNAKKSHGEWEYSLFCKDKLPKIKLSMHTSKMSSWTCDVTVKTLMKLKVLGLYLFNRCGFLKRQVVVLLLWCSTYIDEEYFLEEGLVLDHHIKLDKLLASGQKW